MCHKLSIEWLKAVGNITTTIRAEGLHESSVFFFFSDNGGPSPAANNVPYRGGKFTNWESGPRVRARFMHSPNTAILPKTLSGT